MSAAIACGGIIPAHAGKSLGPCQPPGTPGDHPRSCGEKIIFSGVSAARRGSSPLMRGKACLRLLPQALSRIIPAHAGKRHKLVHRHKIIEDHPRSCGEKFMASLYWRSGLGSSPLMRGKEFIVSSSTASQRIIPAHAGKSGTRVFEIQASWDHPRSCGEKFRRPGGLLCTAGSSPLMRGKVNYSLTYTIWDGIIPAHAGKRRLCIALFVAFRDHPRSCGEKT